MKDQIARHENARHQIAGLNAGRTNARLVEVGPTRHHCYGRLSAGVCLVVKVTSILSRVELRQVNVELRQGRSGRRV